MVDDATAGPRQLWERYASRYDRDTSFYDRFLLGDSRRWACGQAGGDVLEVAIGTGRNLSFYPRATQLVGVDFSPAMLDLARRRANQLGRSVTLLEADAQALPFEDDSFDSIVCTLSLSSIPEPNVAIDEMLRVLRVNGPLLVVGHVASSHRVVHAGQRLLERRTLRLVGDHQTRQVHPDIVATGFRVEHRELLRAGVIERIRAVKPERARGRADS